MVTKLLDIAFAQCTVMAENGIVRFQGVSESEAIASGGCFCLE